MKIIEKVRQAVADLLASDGCNCCRDVGGYTKAQEDLALLLAVPAFKDGSGYDFSLFRSDAKKL